ncbi:zinc finger protein 160 isoform X2 [Coregonus clupeaformis]|uniref:zinc finger protein 160 isoform X2 n=1 Tax=Coregonus clupeaformis TaxID=59861 RepID=UPI001E1C9B29|nr:zinc finger protein 160 isoform X2 [Coregonus clupeaformis]
MSNTVSFSTQIAAIMDVLAKAAVAEITKLVDEGTVVLRLEMCRKENEIEGLQNSVQLMERELRKAQREVATRVANYRQHAEGIQVGSGTLQKGDDKNQQAQAMPVEDPVESFNELQRFGHLEEARGGMEFLVKAEQVEEHVAQGTIQDPGITDSVDFIMDERDSQLWSSVTQGLSGNNSGHPDGSYTTERCLQMFSSQADQYHNPIPSPPSCNSLSTVGKPLDDIVSTVPVKVEPERHPVYHDDAMSESIQAVQGQYRDTLHPVVREGLILHPRLQQPGPSSQGLIRATESTSESHSHNQEHILNKNRLKTKRMVNVWRAVSNQKLFICSLCGKSFHRHCQLEAHQHSHAGVKPYRCLECGKSFTQKKRLKSHQSVHTAQQAIWSQIKTCNTIHPPIRMLLYDQTNPAADDDDTSFSSTEPVDPLLKLNII